MQNNNKNIDLEAPLRSRRSSLPFYKPDIKSGPVRNPGVVPFIWEQKPGLPKPGSPSRPPPAKLGNSVRTRKPVSNFAIEAIDSSTQNFNQTKNEGLLNEELETNKIEKSDQHQAVRETIQPPLMDSTNKDESNGKQKEQLENRKRGEETQSEDSFSDALDTLSRTESFVMNCSISGLTELHSNLPQQNNLPGGDNLLARDFMMDRFLPAAQAVATGSPQYTFRKVSVPSKASPLLGTGTERRIPVPLPYQNQPKYEDNFEEEEEGEEEDEDDEEDLEASRRFQTKGCSFLPSFCVKSSFLLMNPVPGLKSNGVVRPKGGVRRNGSPLIRSSNNGDVSKDSFENYMHSWEPVYKHKQDQTTNNNSPNKLFFEAKKKNSDTSLLTYSSDSPNTRDCSSRSNGEDPFIDAQDANPVVERENVISGFQERENGISGFQERGNGISGFQERGERGNVMSSFQERENAISGFQERENAISSSQGRESVISGFQERENVISGFQERQNATLGFQERESATSGFQERENVISGFQVRENVISGFQERGVQERENVISGSQERRVQERENVISCFQERGVQERENVISGFQERENVISGFQERVQERESAIFGSQERENIISGFQERQNIVKKTNTSLLPLPLPKSPSESWLSKTLPSVNKKPIPSFLGMQNKKQEERWRA